MSRNKMLSKQFYHQAVYYKLIAIYALGIDVAIQYVGLSYSISDNVMLFARVSVCLLINLAILSSSQFRHLAEHSGRFSAGKWTNRKLWALGALPILFAVSALGTSTTLSGMIEAQANQIDQSRDISALCMRLADQASSAAAATEKVVRHQEKIRHVTKGSQTSIEMTKQLATAANNVDCIKEQQEIAGMIKQDEMTKIPLAFINALLSPDAQITTQQFLTGFYISLTFSLLLIGYFFGELSTAMRDKSWAIAQTGSDSPETGPDTSQTNSGPLTDKEIITAIDAKLDRIKVKTGESERPNRIRRSWIAEACKAKYKRARQGRTLDKFIVPTRKKLEPWYKRA